DAADAQAFVVIDLAVTIVLALVGTPLVLAGGRQIKLLHRVRRQVPEADAAAILRARRGGGETEGQRKAQRFRHGITPARRATGFAPCRYFSPARARSARSASPTPDRHRGNPRPRRWRR